MRQRTVLALSRLADSCFAYSLHDQAGAKLTTTHCERTDWFADFLFEKEVRPDIVAAARALAARHGAIKGFVLQLWEAGSADTAAREQLFAKFAGDLLEYAQRSRTEIFVHMDRRCLDGAIRELALDGYEWREGRLARREESIFDASDEESALVGLYAQLAMRELAQVQHDLRLTDDHYVSGHWGDSIKHARDVLEKVLLNAARKRGAPEGRLHRPQDIRDWLRDNGVLSRVEHRHLGALYGWLSADGGHPNMSPAESARILRLLALVEAHFVLLRVQAMEEAAAASA